MLIHLIERSVQMSHMGSMKQQSDVPHSFLIYAVKNTPRPTYLKLHQVKRDSILVCIVMVTAFVALR